MSRRRKGDRKRKQKRGQATSSSAAKLFSAKKEDAKENEDSSAQLKNAPFGMEVSQTLKTVEEIADAIKKTSASLRLEVRRAAHPCDLKTTKEGALKSKVVYFVPLDSVKMGECSHIDSQIRQCNTEPIGFLVAGCKAALFAQFTCTAACLRSFLSEILGNGTNECVMCFEDLCTDSKCVSPCRNSMSCNQCGAFVCIVCAVKIAVENRKLMHLHAHDSNAARFRCPVCRFDRNLFPFPRQCADILKQDFLHELDHCLHAEIIENAKLSKEYDLRKRQPTNCSFCDAPFASKRAAKRALACDKCKHSRYCSRRCRLKDKKKHTEMCRLWSFK